MEKHINDLLYLYDCVIVPGLGGFVANNKSAELNEKTGVFSPPRREIGFNKSLIHNDGLLINHIANAEGISFEACNNKISKHISILKYQLSKGESVQIGNAGELKNDPMGNTVFAPSNEESFSTNSFGLTTFHFNTLEQIKDQNTPSRQLVRRTLRAKSTKQIAASVALILGMFFVSPEFSNQSQQSNFSDIFPKMENIDVRMSTDSQTLIKEKTVYKAKAISEPIEEEVATPPENIYFIIAGSFKEMQPAQEYLAKIIGNGAINAEILHSGSRYRVSLEGYNDKSVAIKALKKFRAQNGFSSAWLFTKK